MTSMSTMQSRASLRRKERRPRSESSPQSPRHASVRKQITTISLSRETKEFLRALGQMGETYDDVIRRLIRYAPIKEQDKIWEHISKKGEFIPLEDV